MTAKHFERIARIIKLTRINGLPAEKEAARRMMYVFRDELERDFPKFNPDKFITACGGHILGEG